MKHLLKDRANEDSGSPISRFLDKIMAPFTQAREAGSSSGEQGTPFCGDSLLTLKKVQGVLRDSWSSAASAPFQAKLKQSRWADTARNHLTTLSHQAPLAFGTTSRPSLADEEIRGLDDIFPHRITGIFPDNTGLPQKTASRPGSRQPADGSGKSRQETLRFDDSLLRKVTWPKEDKPAIAAQTASSTAPETGHPISGLSRIAERPYSQDLTIAAINPIDILETATPAETDEATAVSILGPTPEQMILQVYTISQEQPVPANSEQIAPITDTVIPEIIETSGDAIHEPENDDAIDFSSEDILAINLGTAAPVETAIANQSAFQTLSAAQEPSQLSIRDQLKLDKDLEADLSGFDYMLRNNRILSQSIASLADEYFRKASQEEESVYY